MQPCTSVLTPPPFSRPKPPDTYSNYTAHLLAQSSNLLFWASAGDLVCNSRMEHRRQRHPYAATHPAASTWEQVHERRTPTPPANELAAEYIAECVPLQETSEEWSIRRPGSFERPRVSPRLPAELRRAPARPQSVQRRPMSRQLVQREEHEQAQRTPPLSPEPPRSAPSNVTSFFHSRSPSPAESQQRAELFLELPQTQFSSELPDQPLMSPRRHTDPTETPHGSQDRDMEPFDSTLDLSLFVEAMTGLNHEASETQHLSHHTISPVSRSRSAPFSSHPRPHPPPVPPVQVMSVSAHAALPPPRSAMPTPSAGYSSSRSGSLSSHGTPRPPHSAPAFPPPRQAAPQTSHAGYSLRPTLTTSHSVVSSERLQAPLPAPPSSPPTIRPMTSMPVFRPESYYPSPTSLHQQPSQLFAEAMQGFPNQGQDDDDELPDYEQSQMEASELRRREAARRAAELENRWIDSRRGRGWP